MLSPPKQIPIQLALYKTITCLTRPATTFFCLPKKKLSKTTTRFNPAKKWERSIRQQCIKNKRLFDYIYTIATSWFEVCLMSIKTAQFDIKLCKIIWDNLFLFSLQVAEGVFGTQTNIYGMVAYMCHIKLSQYFIKEKNYKCILSW